jgi:hypothetical protein
LKPSILVEVMVDHQTMISSPPAHMLLQIQM